jgi:hypothetical protein
MEGVLKTQLSLSLPLFLSPSQALSLSLDRSIDISQSSLVEALLVMFFVCDGGKVGGDIDHALVDMLL